MTAGSLAVPTSLRHTDVCLVEADIGMPGLKDAVLFPSGLIDHVAEAESKPHSLSEARATFSF